MTRISAIFASLTLMLSACVPGEDVQAPPEVDTTEQEGSIGTLGTPQQLKEIGSLTRIRDRLGFLSQIRNPAFDDLPILNRPDLISEIDTTLPDIDLSCYFSPTDDEQPAATIEHILEIVEGEEVVHIRLTLDPRFVDNTFGDNSLGWEDTRRHEHRFRDLVGSDHAKLFLVDGAGERVADMKIDYISEDDSAPSGYKSGGVEEGDGRMLEGDADNVLYATSSLDRNLNERGLASFVEHSPATDEDYTPNEDAPEWDFFVVYEVLVSMDIFGEEGLGGATIEFIHASPSKSGDNTIEVEERPCADGFTGFSGQNQISCPLGYCD